MRWITWVGRILMPTPPYQIKGRFWRFSTIYDQKEKSYNWQKTWWNNTTIYGDLVYYVIINTDRLNWSICPNNYNYWVTGNLWVLGDLRSPPAIIYMDIVEWYRHIFSTLPGPFSLITPIVIYCAPFTVVGRIDMAATNVFPTNFHIMWTVYYT